jgi:hypothetical protein
MAPWAVGRQNPRCGPLLRPQVSRRFCGFPFFEAIPLASVGVLLRNPVPREYPRLSVKRSLEPCFLSSHARRSRG